MYGWSRSLQEMDNILQLDLVPFSDYSGINSSVVIVTNSSAPMVSHLWMCEILSGIFVLKGEKDD